MKIKKFNESNYPGRLKNFYEEQILNKNNIFDVLFRHLDIWYRGYQISLYDMEIIITLDGNKVYTKLMEILSKLEKDLKYVGYYEPTIFLETPKNRFSHNKTIIKIKEI